MRQRAIIALDMILDVRYGVLSRLNQEAADELVVKPEYRGRCVDDFEKLTNGVIKNEDYKNLLNQNDPDTLFFSRMTDFLLELRMDVKGGLVKVDRGVQEMSFEFDINVWPYKLEDGEKEIIRRAAQRMLPHPSVVTVVDLSPEFLTPTYVDNTYDMMAWYDHELWLKPHQEMLIKRPMPLVVLLTPQIASSGVIPDKVEGIGNPFSCRSAMLVKFIALHYMNVSRVCFNPEVTRLVETAMRQESAHPDHVPQERT